jgi:4-hydroxybenzoate polyprenyltransferase
VIYLRRLFQPRKPAFWLMLVLNALSTVLMWIVQRYTLTPLASLVIAVFALGNAWLGLRLAWQLLSSPPEPRP